jgi:hypothetical protein
MTAPSKVMIPDRHTYDKRCDFNTFGELSIRAAIKCSTSPPSAPSTSPKSWPTPWRKASANAVRAAHPYFVETWRVIRADQMRAAKPLPGFLQ